MAISLSSISKGRCIAAPKIFLYSSNGLGKTTWASQAPNPIFLFTEPGIGILDLAKFDGEDGYVLRKLDDVIAALESLLNEEHDFRTVVIDSTSGLEMLIRAKVAVDHNCDGIEGLGYGKGFVYVAEEMVRILHILDRIQAAKNMAVVFLGHAEVKKYEAPDLTSYDRYQPRLDKRIVAPIVDWCDVVMFGNYRVITTEEEEGFRKRTRAIGQGERVLFTEERPTHIAKNRLGLPYELPLDFGAFQVAMAASISDPAAA